jgi:hypothetical protein
MVKLKVQERPEGSWALYHMIGRTEHNHPPHNSASYWEHRQLSAIQKEVVIANHAAGVSASRIKPSLKTSYPNLEIASRDLYNQTARISREIRKGQPANEALIKELIEAKEKGDLFFEYSLGEEGRIQKLFIAHKSELTSNSTSNSILIINSNSNLAQSNTLMRTLTSSSSIVYILFLISYTYELLL